MKYDCLTIGELIDNNEVEIKTGPFGTQLKAKDYVDKGIPVVNVRNIGLGSIIEEKLEYISDVTRDRLKDHIIIENDIVFGRKGAVERHAFIDRKHNNWFQGSDCIRLRIKTNKIYPRFASYYFLTNEHKSQIMQECSHGTTMASLNQSILKQIKIPMPLYSEQKAIAATLCCLDDKIELNNQINKTLEEMAQAIFKSWFVDFEPFQDGEFVDSELGLIPKGWRVESLGNLCQVQKGLSYKGKHLVEAGMPMINLGNVKPGGEFRFDKMKYYNGEYKDRHIVKSGDIIMANTDMTSDRAILGSPIIIPKLFSKQIIYTHHLFAFSNLKLPKTYFYYYFKSDTFRERAESYANGTTVLAISKEDVISIKIVIPTDEVMHEYDSIVSNIVKFKEKGMGENQQLSNIRDTLLPKLMSGEIRVPIEEVQQNGTA